MGVCRALFNANRTVGVSPFDEILAPPGAKGVGGREVSTPRDRRFYAYCVRIRTTMAAPSTPQMPGMMAWVK
jgi:hypothetical protein